MKKMIVLIFFWLPASGAILHAQTNIFPGSGNVGIGTTTPANKLEVRGGWIYTDGSLQVDGGDVYISRVTMPYGYVARPNIAGFKNLQFAVAGGGPLDNLAMNSVTSYFTGNVGIGTTTPTYPLEVHGNAYLNGTLSVDGGDILIARTSYSYGYLLRPNTDGYRNLAFAVSGGGPLDNVQVVSNATSFSGAVGIGTTSTPGYGLAVNGAGIFTKVVVKAYPWSDYVFDSAYKLAPLGNVEKFIKANHHLPDVPAADSVERNGIDLGGNQAVLLKKIEELTLYLIEQDKNRQKQDLRLGEQGRLLKEQSRQLKEQQRLIGEQERILKAQEGRLSRLEQLKNK